MSRLPDLVRDTRLNTSFQDDFTIHHHDDSDDENNARSTWRSEYWKVTAHLGHGGCGDVWLQECVRGKRGYDKRAVKIIPRLNLRDKKDRYMAELEAIAKFSQKRYSKCFVKLLGWYDTDSSLYIAMEYFPLGDLQNYMTETGPIDETDAREISFQVLEGLSYMHREGFAHRDIKPGNVLIRSQPPRGKWWVKISDFGISKRIEASTKAVSSVRGTIPYMAPELLWHEPSTLNPINFQAADMWAFGEMVYRMLTQTAVFPTQNTLVNYLVATDLFPTEKLSNQDASSDATSFIRSLMEPRPDKRITSEKAMEHAWVASLNDHYAYVSRLPTPTPLDPSPSSLPAPSTNPNPWATVSTHGSDGSLLTGNQASAGVPGTSNESYLEIVSPPHSSKTIEMNDYSDTYSAAGDAISEPASRISEVSAHPSTVSHAVPLSPPPPPRQQQQHNSQAPSPRTPWPRIPNHESLPPVRLPYGRAQPVHDDKMRDMPSPPPQQQQKQQQNYSQAPSPRMPWPRNPDFETRPPVRLAQGRAQASQGARR